MNERKRKWYLQVAKECREYADKYSCSIRQAIEDYELEDGNGVFGLTRAEKNTVLTFVHLHYKEYAGTQRTAFRPEEET